VLKVIRQFHPVYNYTLINYPIVNYWGINDNNNTHIAFPYSSKQSYTSVANILWDTKSLYMCVCEQMYVSISLWLSLSWSSENQNSEIQLDHISELTVPILFKLVAIKSLYLHYIIKV